MPHAKAVYRRGEVVPDLLLFSVEAHPLRNVTIAGEAEHVEGHFEADRLLVTTEAGGLFAMELVAGCCTLVLRRDIPSHVEALHSGVGVFVMRDEGDAELVVVLRESEEVQEGS